MPAYVMVKSGFDQTTAEDDALMCDPGIEVREGEIQAARRAGKLPLSQCVYELRRQRDGALADG
jgi:hypothetical protein